MSETGQRVAIGGWCERFDDRADLWLWHAPDWFWRHDRGHWPDGRARSGHTAPLVATLHMIWRRWRHGEEVCWWGYAEDVRGYPHIRQEPLNVSRVIRKQGLLSHGVQLSSPLALVLLELLLRRTISWRQAREYWRTSRLPAPTGEPE